MAYRLHRSLTIAMLLVVALSEVNSDPMEMSQSEDDNDDQTDYDDNSQPNMYRVDQSEYAKSDGNGLCNDGLDVLGAAYFENKLMLIVFDAKNKQHVVFEKNTSNYYPYMTMKMDKSYPLKEFGYTEDGNKKINSAFGVTIEAKKKNEKPEEVLVISYGSLAEKTEAISITKRQKASFPPISTRRDVFAAVLNYQLLGYYLVKNNSNWLMNDMQIDQQRLWAQEGQYPFYITMIGSTNNEKIILSQDGRKGKKVEWKRVTGFITEDTTVHIFADSYLYIFTDLSMVNKHLTHTIFEIPVLKIQQSEFFVCNNTNNETELRFPGPLFDIQESKTKGRTTIIYLLFGAHFVVAVMMIFLIMVYSNTTTREGLRRMGRRRRSSKNGPKIVRRSRQSYTSNASATDSSAQAASSKSSKSASKSHFSATSGTNSVPTTTTTTSSNA